MPRDEDPIGALRRAANGSPLLDAETEKQLLQAIRKGSSAALQQLMASHLRLVLATARRYAGNGVSFEDLVAEGNLGLVEAARRFDVERGTRFATYAAWWVRAFIRRYALSNRRIVPVPSTRNARKLLSSLRKTQRRLTHEHGRPPEREEVAEALGVPPEDVALIESVLGARDVALGPTEPGSSHEVVSIAPSPEEEVEAAEDREHREERVAEALALLSEREREIVRRRFFEDDSDTLAVLGDALGISRERVRQIEKRARQKLRLALLDEVA